MNAGNLIRSWTGPNYERPFGPWFDISMILEVSQLSVQWDSTKMPPAISAFAAQVGIDFESLTNFAAEDESKTA